MAESVNKERLPIGRVWDAVAVNVVLLGAAFALAAAWARSLPERYPVHWNLAGEPDRWSQRGLAEWYTIPFCALGLAALLVTLALLLPRIPLSLVNVPKKERFMALSTEGKGLVMTWLVRWLLHLSSLQTLLMITIHWMTYRAALHEGHGPALGTLVGVGAVYLAWIVWLVVGFGRRVREAEGGQGGQGGQEGQGGQGGQGG